MPGYRIRQIEHPTGSHACRLSVLGHARRLPAALERHAPATADVLVTDPGAGNNERLPHSLANRGIGADAEYREVDDAGPSPPLGGMPRRGRLQ